MIARGEGAGYHRGMAPEETDRVLKDISHLLATRLGAKGPTLAIQLRRAGRSLPKAMRREARVLIRAEQLRLHPKLYHTIQPAEVTRAHKALRSHLRGVSALDRRLGGVLGFLGAVSAGVLLIGAVAVTVLVWRGYL